MTEELKDVIDYLKLKFKISGDVKVLHTEDGVMHTIRSNKGTYKALKTDKNIGWKIIEMR